MTLRDLARASNGTGLVGEMEPKVQAYARAYDHDADEIRASLAETLQTMHFPAGLLTDFEADQVTLQPHCGGRLWELRQPDDRPLIASAVDDDGGSFQIPIYVGVAGGALKVLR